MILLLGEWWLTVATTEGIDVEKICKLAMTSIIKNQIIKHLSKFVRNITADQISVQILSGKGELKNIELNEIVLSEVDTYPVGLSVTPLSTVNAHFQLRIYGFTYLNYQRGYELSEQFAIE
ncbi:hypothetical protein WUBG_11820 [Wuchereria bancrofti]|uniref:Uncharacterized protein n=1 Tax=Wuchereria bancrofti TaxID=6293 RepID=J9EJR1_WUCBA|nr:hypothetical protein WUBG_11820 [Wuchereria bancrofti]